MYTFLVREAEQKDLTSLLQLYGELGEGDAARLPTGPARSSEILRTILADRSRRLSVITRDDAVVGTADLILVPNLTHGGRPWAVIENVVVSDAVRGRGAGTVLLEHLIATARAANCYKVQLHSGRQRVDAHRFYRRLGFESVAEGFKLYLDGTQVPGAR